MEIVSWLSKQATKLADNFTNNYHFFLKRAPEGQVDSSSILSITAYASREESAVVPCSYKWIRIRNGIAEEREEFRGNSYVCGLEDVGSTLQVHITSNDQSHPGTAIVDFDNIALDAVMKQWIKRTLSKGFATFHASILCGDEQLQCKLDVAKNQITLSHQKTDQSFTFPYSLSNPMLTLNKITPNTVDLAFDQESQAGFYHFFGKVSQQKMDKTQKMAKFTLAFHSKKARDQFLLVLKAFNTQKQLKKSPIIHKIQRIHDGEDNFDLLMEVQSLRNDLVKMYKAYNKQREQKFTYFSQNMKLQEEIAEILAAYSVMFSQKAKQAQQQTNKKQHRRGNSVITLMKAFKELQEENKALKQAISGRNNERQSKQHQFQYHLILQIEQLQQENQSLKKTISQLEKNLELQTSTSNMDHSSATLERYIKNINPESENDLTEIERLKDLVSEVEIQKNEWKVKCKQAMSHFEKQKEQYERIKVSLQKKVSELSEQLMMMKRRDDSMNRSFSLSMELEDYNYQQNKILRDQNDFLLSQAQKLSKLCEKYKNECKRLKQKQRQ